MRNGLIFGASLVGLVALCGACGGSDDDPSRGVSGGVGPTTLATGGSAESSGGAALTSLSSTAGGLGHPAGGASAGTGTEQGGNSASVATGGAMSGGSTTTRTTGGVIGTGTSGAAPGGTWNTTGATFGTSVSGGASMGGASVANSTGGAGGVGTNHTNVTGGTPAGGASCGPRGGVSNTGGFGDELQPIPFECTSDDECASGICYDGPSAQTWSCRVPCDTTQVGQQGSCAVGQVCTFTANGQKAACLDACTPFEAPSACKEGDWCYPAPHPSFIAGAPISGLCLASGEYAEGVRCPGGGCGLDLLCTSPSLNTFDTYHCERACDPAASAGQPGSCSGSETCIEVAEGRGYCTTICDPFASTNQCVSGEWCYPFHQSTHVYLGVQGRCVRTGKHPAGASCTLGECAEGLKCSGEPEPWLGGPTVCRPICHPHAANPCQPGQTCIPDRMQGVALDVGTCHESCTLWQSDGCAAGCGSNEWCAPSYLDPGFGRCQPAAGQGAGESCGLTKACAAGTLCLCRFEDSCLSDGRCERLCALSPSGTDPVHCLPNEVCAPEPVVGGWSTFGTCRAGCDYDAGVACADPDETCVPGELLPHGKDTCLDVPMSGCSSTAPVGTACGPTALCLASTLMIRCRSVCRTSLGAFGTINHPDCPDPDSTCVEIEPGRPYGECS